MPACKSSGSLAILLLATRCASSIVSTLAVSASARSLATIDIGQGVTVGVFDFITARYLLDSPWRGKVAGHCSPKSRQEARRYKQKAPLGTGLSLQVGGLPNRSHAIIEALPQIGCRSLATVDPKLMERRPKPTPHP